MGLMSRALGDQVLGGRLLQVLGGRLLQVLGGRR
jgi:hypothetical protein